MFRTPLWGTCLAGAASLLLTAPGLGQVPPPFRNTIDTIPAGWTGPVFELSRDYPTALPAEPKPWKAFDFKTQQKEYLQAVVAYAIEGNEAVQWRVQDNAVRKWYHAPGLLDTGTPTFAASGREFIHGLTRERTSPKQELDPNQTTRVSNWAVGFYNPIAAFTIGKVWANPDAPDTAAVKFDDGAVAFKLLFTTATDSQVPFLANSMKWQANVDLVDLVPPSTTRQPRDVLLLQVDVAVRDDRADDTTGWVFGTFMYQNDAPGAGPLQRLIPVGLMWGNDPGLTKPKYDAGERPVQTWLNKAGMPATKSPHFGWLDRLNGPVDNARSSCLSCHARAVVPYVPPNTVPQAGADPDDPAKKFFANTKAGDVYEGAPAGSGSLDYSLQLAVGVRLFPGAAPQHPLASQPIEGFNFRAGEPEEASQATPAPPKAPPPASPAPGETNWWLWVGGAVVLVIVVLAILWLRSKRPSGV
jgi:hypothetical protein